MYKVLGGTFEKYILLGIEIIEFLGYPLNDFMESDHQKDHCQVFPREQPN